MTLMVTPLSGRDVQLSGTVQDENPAGVTVKFSGVVSGSTTVMAGGSYSLTATASGLGQVQAVGTDQEGLNSNAATANVTSNSPSLTLNSTPGAGKTVTLAGQVTDESPGGLTVTFTGVAAGSTTTKADGSFSYTTQASDLGTIQATTADAWGLVSNQPSVTLTSQAPTLTLNVTYGPQRTITLTGKVSDESPGGLTVSFSDKASGTVVTNADGTFSFTTQATGLGTVRAITTDVWGLYSGYATVTLTSTAPVISDFTATTSIGNLWTFRGRVTDEGAQGLVVRLGGMPSLTGQTVTVGADGWFTIMIELQDGEDGTATAQATDWWGLDSNLALTSVNPI